MHSEQCNFFGLLPFIFVATADAGGWPLATMLTGQSGFVHACDPFTLRVDALPDRQDAAGARLGIGQEIGLLGIDFSTRRRNRANGEIADRNVRGFTVAVSQSFGNCAKYIQRRVARHAPRLPGSVDLLSALDAKARALILNADTLFVASRSRPQAGAAGGLDISHRGGRPGFVAVDGDCLFIPDFPGNRYYNTLGNLLGEPRGSLLFIDFDNGDLLQLQGFATINWSAHAGAFQGAERLWRFQIVRGWRRHAACPLHWSFIDQSPHTLKTGGWDRSRLRQTAFGDGEMPESAATAGCTQEML
jgi:predicted pyridoxine 5'-phosphate oxidase superfamily flavin-nucleotide-binding protein